MPDWWEGFKVGQLVEDKPPPGTSIVPSQALVIRLCPENENPYPVPRPVIEIQWIATGATSLMFTTDMRRGEQ
jgi:uncharacterized protein YbbK (DUF523 family)